MKACTYILFACFAGSCWVASGFPQAKTGRDKPSGAKASQASGQGQSKVPRRADSKAAEVNFDELKAKANLAREANQLEAAIRHYRELVEIKPDWAEGWWYLGTLYYDSDQYPAGANAFKRFSSLEPRNGQGWGMLGLCEFQVKEYIPALDHLAKARELGLGGNEELARVVRYHQAVLLTMGRQFEAALNLLRSFAMEHRESPTVFDAMGKAVLRLHQPYEQLTALQREMIREFGKAAFLAGEQRIAESQEVYRRLEERYRGKPGVAYAYGELLLNLRDFDQAVVFFKKELDAGPNHVASLLQISLLAIKAGKFEEALPYATRALSAEPDNFVAHYAAGRVYLELNQVEKAVALLEKATKIAPDAPSVYFVLSRAYTRAKRPEDAARARAEFARLEDLDRKRRGELRAESSAEGPDLLESQPRP
jgi:predicted Zn-dependent protease